MTNKKGKAKYQTAVYRQNSGCVVRPVNAIKGQGVGGPELLGPDSVVDAQKRGRVKGTIVIGAAWKLNTQNAA